MVSVSFAVQAHPSRSLAAAALANELGGEVVWDPDHEGRRSPWRTFRHLLASMPPGATHRFQIQDDATVCPGLRLAVERLVAARPDRLLVFYVGRQQFRYTNAILEACARDRPLVELPPNHWCPVVATCWPVGLAAGLVEWADAQNWPEAFVADDEIVGRYLKEIGVSALATVPSLVDHLDATPSVMGKFKRTAARRAVCYIGDCGECLDGLDWSLEPHPQPRPR